MKKIKFRHVKTAEKWAKMVNYREKKRATEEHAVQFQPLLLDVAGGGPRIFLHKSVQDLQAMTWNLVRPFRALFTLSNLEGGSSPLAFLRRLKIADRRWPRGLAMTATGTYSSCQDNILALTTNAIIFTPLFGL